MIDGHVVGEGGTLLVTRRRDAAPLSRSGLPYQVVDMAGTKLYGN